MKKLKLAIIILIACILLIFGYILLDNSTIEITEFSYTSDKIGKSFDGYRICVISDYHNGTNHKKLIDAVEKSDCDIICIAGDLVDMTTTDFSNVESLLDELCSITDVYYTYGNHEVWSTSLTGTKTPIIQDALSDIPVKLLNNKVATIEKNGELLNLIGYGDDIYDDFDGLYKHYAMERLTQIHRTLDKSVPSVLICHRPQYFSDFSTLGYDVILSGHLHGGLVNINPIRNYILKNHFGNISYTKGVYEANGSTMFVSGGLAGKGIIPRVFNTPEIMIVELKSK